MIRPVKLRLRPKCQISSKSGSPRNEYNSAFFNKRLEWITWNNRSCRNYVTPSSLKSWENLIVTILYSGRMRSLDVRGVWKPCVPWWKQLKLPSSFPYIATCCHRFCSSIFIWYEEFRIFNLGSFARLFDEMSHPLNLKCLMCQDHWLFDDEPFSAITFWHRSHKLPSTFAAYVQHLGHLLDRASEIINWHSEPRISTRSLNFHPSTLGNSEESVTADTCSIICNSWTTINPNHQGITIISQ